MWQRVDTQDRQSKIRVEFVSNAERIRLQAKSQQLSVPIERRSCFKNRECIQFVARESYGPKTFRLCANETGDYGAIAVITDSFDAHWLIEQRACENLPNCN